MGTYFFENEADDRGLARKTAQVFQMPIKLMHLNVLKHVKAVNGPDTVTEVVLALCVLDEVKI